MAKNSNQTVITAVSVVVALAAVTYALVSKVEKPNTVTAVIPSVEVSETKTYEVAENNPVVLELDGKKITRMEVLDNFAASGSSLPDGTNVEEVFPLLQDQYLVGALLKKAALEKGYSKDTPEIAMHLNAALDQALRAAYIREMGEEAVTEDDLKKAYDDIVKNAPEIKERKARHILVSDEAKAKSLIEELKNGADFALLATENSEGPTNVKGGDLGYFAQNEMVPEFAVAAFSLDIGGVSNEPVKTQFGYHIIKIEDERTREKPSFEDVKAQLEQQLRQAVIGEKLAELRQNAQIEVYTYSGDELPKANAGGDAETQKEPEVAPAPAAADSESRNNAETNGEEAAE